MNGWTVKAHNLRATQAHILATILQELMPNPEHPPDDLRQYAASNGGDPAKLRGIPAIGRTVAGAIPGSTPHQTR